MSCSLYVADSSIDGPLILRTTCASQIIALAAGVGMGNSVHFVNDHNVGSEGKEMGSRKER